MSFSVAREAWADGLRPEPPIDVAEWSGRHLYLDDTTSAEPGRYSADRTPYVREPMACLSVTNPIQRIVLMWGAQLGKSTTGNAWIGYVIDNSPGPMLVVQPRVQDALDYSRLRIEPMVAASPRLRRRVAPKWTRDGGNTLATKKYPGGVLLVTGANSAAGLKSRPIRYLFLDEVDEYPWDVEEQGDPVTLAVRRTNTFGHRRKVLITSTPTIRGRSRIEAEYQESDRRRYHVPCVLCGHHQVLIFERLKWPKGKPEEVRYECEECEKRFPEAAKREFLTAGRWVAERETRDVAGFHLPSWYSPLGWLSWREIATEWVARRGDPNALKVYVNTVMAETFEERGEAPEWERVYERRESYPVGSVPAGVEFITVGVDVQDDYVVADIWGWGWDKESWLIQREVIDGRILHAETRANLTELLHRTYVAPTGIELPIAALAIDTGHEQEAVVGWAREAGDGRIMLIKGDHWKNWVVMLGAPSKSEVSWRGKRVGLLLWPVGGALIKEETYGFLRLAPPLDDEPYPPGWIHLPQVDDEYCKQLVSEDLVTRTDRKGWTKREWVKNRTRNEALDCRVYARAAAERLGLGRMVGERPAPPAAAKRTGPDDDRDGSAGRRGEWLSRGGGGGPRRGGWLK